MPIDTNRPVKELTFDEFKEQVGRRVAYVVDHASVHLSEAQRKVFNKQELIHMVEKERPKKIYLQANGRFSNYYRRSDGYRRLILEIEANRIAIVTFTDPDELPRVSLEENE